MPSTPIGGGIDGPNYSDYIDVTDQQQLAGASSAMKEKLLLTQDTLTLDIAKFSGEMKSYAAKSEAPIIAPYIKARSTGPLETTLSNLELFEEEFVRLIEQLPPKLRGLLLKNMNLPVDQRDPELNGLEQSLQQHVAVRLWAKGILQRHRHQKDDEESEEERKGIFDIEDEELLPLDTVIPKTSHVPISALRPYEMDDEALKKQIQSNTLFMLETQYGILKMVIANLPVNDPAKAILTPLPRLMARMIKQASTFVDLANMLNFKKAKKIARGLESLDTSIIDEQHIILERASNYSAGAPSNAIIALAKAMLTTTIVGCSILRGEATPSAFNIDGIVLLQSLLLSSSPTLVGQSLMATLNSLTKGLVSGGETENKAKVLEIGTLICNTLVLVLCGQEAIPRLVAFEPELAAGLAAMEIDAPTPYNDEEDKPEENLQHLARATAVQLASGSLIVHEVAKTSISTLVKTKSETTISTLNFALLIEAAAMAQTLLKKIGGSGAELYAALMAPTIHENANKLQNLADIGSLKSSVAQTINELRLGELIHENTSLSEQLTTREKVFERLGLKVKDIEKAQQEHLLLSALLVLEINYLSIERRQVVPTMNVVI